MTDINAVMPDSEMRRVSREETGFSKKNAWKNEWEKAQLDNSVEHKTSSNKDKNLMPSSQDTTNMDGLELEPVKGIAKEPYESKQMQLSDGFDSAQSIQGLSLNAANQSSIIDRVHTGSPIMSRLDINASQSIRNGQLQMLKQTQYVQGLLEKVGAQMKSEFKLQNLNIHMTDKGAKLILRDYRLDSGQLKKVMNEIHRHLNDAGISVAESIVNGVIYE